MTEQYAKQYPNIHFSAMHPGYSFFNKNLPVVLKITLLILSFFECRWADVITIIFLTNQKNFNSYIFMFLDSGGSILDARVL